MDYKEFIKNKVKTFKQSGFEPKNLNSNLFDFQKHIVKKACNAGKYAIFADCGLGKTLMQLEWASQVYNHTKKPVLILAPLAVSAQTINEGVKFGIKVSKYDGVSPIQITNYEQIENIDLSFFDSIVLDESSILKNFTGKLKNKIIDSFENYSYKLACTATPAPNDLNEIGNHAEFLNVMDSADMRMRWFVRDEGMNNYRLKGHADSDFYGWISTWSTVLRTPSDIGFNSKGYELPALNILEKTIETKARSNGKLFNDNAVNATNFNQELRLTKIERMSEVAEIVNNSKENFIIWIKQNEEADYLKKLIPEAVEVRGSDKQEIKEQRLLDFANNKTRVLITKTKIAQFGMNFQNCNNQIFASLDFSFESLYQAVRRSYRFGQENEVNIYIITTDTMTNVINTIHNKQNMFNEMMSKITKYVNNADYKLKMDYEMRIFETDRVKLVNADCVDFSKTIESESIDLSVFSPPFSTLFTYSDNIHDMGNCESDDEFFAQNEYLLKELYRIMKNSRLVCIHSKDLARYKNSSGYTGLYDFTGLYHKAMESAGFKYHSKITIWTDPVLEMQRTKTQRLLYKQVTKDSTYSGVGLPEYVTIFRKWEGEESEWNPVTNKNKSNFDLDTWQKWASPVWFDIKRTDVLNNYKAAKDPKDEKHIAPLQLEVIKRLVAMWSNPDELVYTPFAGIGSELFESLKLGRRAIGSELKPEYFDTAVNNIKSVLESEKQKVLF